MQKNALADQKINNDVYSSSIIGIENIFSNYLIFKLNRPKNFDFNSGQYIPFLMYDNDGEFQFNYSIASSSTNRDSIELCIQSNGNGRGIKFWKNLQIGDNVLYKEAKGDFKIIDPNCLNVFIAGGSGISPIRSLLFEIFKNMNSKRMNIHLIYACKYSEAMPFKNEFINLTEKFKGRFKLHLTAEETNSADIQQGNVISAIDNSFPLFTSESNFYICGSPKMVDVVFNKLLDNKVLLTHIFKEF